MSSEPHDGDLVDMSFELHHGDLVEVLADDPEHDFYYGEVTNTAPVTVNYISKLAKSDTWRFDEVAYEVERECINFVVNVQGKKKEAAWRELGFIYRGDHEIVHEDDVDSEEEDEDWEPSEAEEEGEEEEESEDDEDDSVQSSEDEAAECDEDFDDDLDLEGEGGLASLFSDLSYGGDSGGGIEASGMSPGDRG